ncbi:MAG: hypothetical protein ACI9W4_001364 [Rhodothermales bacterium]|jgi:hypothetical protein
MPEEIMIIAVFAIFVGMVTSLTKMILTHREKTSGISKAETSSSSSVTTSELERMMHRAVRKATDPLADRLDELEDRLDMPALAAKGERIDLDAALEERSPAMAPRRSKTR